ncbi:MAG: hypothetical protein JWN03_5601 [Nocardia sp.]|uniref:hypothetical protein n=1 Tax=Nocardia sp. TaxID=1821 RepID=UPI0026215A1B|nr:hypothetical protein [Nocardia sp.]MCU1645326.1 hypothetical protein [Nocardia sp.]
MSDPAAIFDLHAELSDELIAAIALVLLSGDEPDSGPSVRRIPDTQAYNVFRNPRGWR